MSQTSGTANGKVKKHSAGDVPRGLSTKQAVDAGIEIVKAEVVDPRRYLPKIVTSVVTIRGVSPLIVENFNKKTRDQILANHKGEAKEVKAPKDVEALFIGSKYLNRAGEDCFPCGPIRASIITAARISDTEKMSVLKQAIFIENPEDSMEDLLPLKFSKCECSDDPVRLPNGKPDIRIRAKYFGWSLRFRVNAVQNVLSSERLLQLVAHAGLGGLGGWRPAGKVGMGGVFGRFEIASLE